MAVLTDRYGCRGGTLQADEKSLQDDSWSLRRFTCIVLDTRFSIRDNASSQPMKCLFESDVQYGVKCAFFFRGCSFLSPDKLAPFNGQFLNGSACIVGEGTKSIHIKAYSEVTAHDT